jgi:nucleoid-associated protein YgaU
LFLIALILVVSLTVDDPLDKSKVVEAGTTPSQHLATPTPAKDPGASDPKPSVQLAQADNAQGAKPGASSAGLLNATVQTGGAQPAVDAAASPDTSLRTPAPVAGPAPAVGANGLPAGALLKTLEGLQDSILPDMKLYTWQEKDSYRLIANKYYGDWTKFTVLRRSNEGRNDVQPGEQIFVPVFDSEPTVAAAPITAPPVVPVKGAKLASNSDKSADKSAKKAAAPKATPSGKKVHVVKNGESLWKIAHQELGDGGRWKEIYALNKDVLPSESAVHAGQTLRLP